MVTKIENYESHQGGDISYEDQLRINDVLSLTEEGDILDIGCFDGFVSEFFLKKGLDSYGTEISAKAATKASLKGVKIIRSDIEDGLPFRSKSFQGVYAGEVIEHIMDTDYLLEEIKRVLKSKGYAIITTPNVASLPMRFKLLSGKFYPASFSQNGEHVRFFTKSGFRELLLDHKFCIELLVTKPFIIPFLARYTKFAFLNVNSSNFGERIIAKVRKS